MRKIITSLLIGLLLIVSCENPSDSESSSIAVSGISLDYSSAGLALDEGDSFTVTATVSPSNATEQTVDWSSLDESVASVSGGTITAQGTGTTTIIAEAGDYTAAISVTVETEMVDVTGVALSSSSEELDMSDSVQGTVQLTATLSPSDATNTAVNWSSSNSSVATVDIYGLVTAVAAGSATITISPVDTDYTASCLITVTEVESTVSVTSVTIDQDDLSLTEGDSTQLSATVYPSDATDSSLNWSSSDSEVAIINAAGLVCALSAGTSTITVTTIDGNYTDSVLLTVEELVSDDYLEKGISALFDSDFDTAIEYIDLAYDTDTENQPEIALWKSLALLASTTISDEVQEIAAAAGLTDYPTTLNDLIFGDFSTEMEVLDYADTYSYWDGSEMIYEIYESYSYLPSITLPTTYDADDLYNDDDEGLDILNVSEYSIAILYNLGQSYSDGLTDPLTSIVSVLTETNEEVITCLEAVDTSTSISLSADMLFPGESDYELTEMGWPTENGEFADYVIGEAEFNTVIGTFELINFLLNYSLSVTYDAEFDTLVELMVDSIANGGVTDTSLFPEYPMSEMLAEYDLTDEYLDAAKTSFSSALGHFADAAEDIRTRTDSSSPFAISQAELGDEIWNNIDNSLSIVSEFCTLLKGSVDDEGTTIVIPCYDWDSADVFSDYSETTISSGDNILALEINASALFDQSLLDPANFIEMDSNREPIIYCLSNDYTTYSEVTSMDSIDDSYYSINF
ncbi:MAG: Ig-like domain-containing protein, partial [Spirochaetales bacterium]|nr:Ig-like domain-containing protein [Spirochaetales bacterium]